MVGRRSGTSSRTHIPEHVCCHRRRRGRLSRRDDRSYGRVDCGVVPAIAGFKRKDGYIASNRRVADLLRIWRTLFSERNCETSGSIPDHPSRRDWSCMGFDR